MTQKETVTRNIGLTFDFVNYLMDNESEVDKLPENFRPEFIEKDFPKRQASQDENQTVEPVMQKKYIKVKNSFAM